MLHDQAMPGKLIELLSHALDHWVKTYEDCGAGADGPHGAAVSPSTPSGPHSEGWFEGTGVCARHNHWRQCLDRRRSHYLG